uniref:esterase OVCA2-like n=1 Tax=Erigeron canadensis TaxID=72917 RepID=UPI001CB904CF|nr:esterase OVCA2-like [Erigeron canadensis]
MFIHLSMNHLHKFPISNVTPFLFPKNRILVRNLSITNEQETVLDHHRKPRILFLHGFRTSGHIFKTQLNKWPESVLDKMDLFFPDAPFPCTGKSQVERIFDPPYYEWYRSNKDFTEYENFEECLEFIEECMIKYAPIDGLAGFSQGAMLAAALPGLQTKGIALTRVPKIEFLMIISGGKFKNKSWAEKAFSLPIQCPSLHFIGDADFLKSYGIELLKSAEDYVVIRHPRGHTIPKLGGEGLETMLKFIDRIQKIVSKKEAK